MDDTRAEGPSCSVNVPGLSSSMRRKRARWRLVFSVMYAMGWPRGEKWIEGDEEGSGLAHIYASMSCTVILPLDLGVREMLPLP